MQPYVLSFMFLLFVPWMVGTDNSVRCCLRFSRSEIPRHIIVGYFIQDTPQCPIKAIVFCTKKNKQLCADPESDWIRPVLKVIDQRLTITKKYRICNAPQKPQGTPSAPNSPTSTTQTSIKKSSTTTNKHWAAPSTDSETTFAPFQSPVKESEAQYWTEGFCLDF